MGTSDIGIPDGREERLQDPRDRCLHAEGGAVFALEASRLARNSTDWHRLLELCAFTDTLIIDEDGCYSPADFNDQLVLGLKGTMSQAELHFLRGRLQGGKINKAKRGELKSPLPVGFVYDEEGRTVIDPDAEVRHAVTMLFEKFRETGSACGAVRAFVREGMQFPKRAYGGAWNGKLIWGRLSEGRVEGALKNPAYAGAYVYGRYQSVKNIAPDGTFLTRITKAPMASWTVLIKDHHEGYISWETSHGEQGDARAEPDQRADLSGTSTGRTCLPSGLTVCRICGRRITVRYIGNGGIIPSMNATGRSGKLCPPSRASPSGAIASTARSSVASLRSWSQSRSRSPLRLLKNSNQGSNRGQPVAYEAGTRSIRSGPGPEAV